MSGRDETDAVRERYARRAAGDRRYHPLQPSVWQSRQELERATLAMLARQGWHDLGGRRLLEVGCGSGAHLMDWLRWGCPPAQLRGLELLPERHAQARALLPAAVDLWLGDALQAPVEAASQDLVMQYTVFSSLLDDGFQQALARRMWQWVRPGGAVLWYDFTYDNPSNPDVRGVPVRRLRALFPEANITLRRVTLAPPLARAVCRLHPTLYTLLNGLPPLRTHVLGWLVKPGPAAADNSA